MFAGRRGRQDSAKLPTLWGFGRWSAGELRCVRRAVSCPPTLPTALGRVGQPNVRSPERVSASQDVGRGRVASSAGRHRRARRSLTRRPFQERSPEQWPVLLVVVLDRKTVFCFCGVSYGLSLSYRGILDR